MHVSIVRVKGYPYNQYTNEAKKEKNEVDTEYKAVYDKPNGKPVLCS